MLRGKKRPFLFGSLAENICGIYSLNPYTSSNGNNSGFQSSQGQTNMSERHVIVGIWTATWFTSSKSSCVNGWLYILRHNVINEWRYCFEHELILLTDNTEFNDLCKWFHKKTRIWCSKSVCTVQCPNVLTQYTICLCLRERRRVIVQTLNAIR